MSAKTPNTVINSDGPQCQYMELESVRGLAAILVVLYHIPIWNPWFDIRLIGNGYLMVDLFFVLSGFVMGTAYAQKIRTSAEFIRFQWLRLGRLYPLHALFLVIFLGIEILRLLAAGKTGAGAVHVQAFSVNSLEAFVQQVFLIQAVGPTGNAYTFNRPAWSISVEFYIYIIFGLLVLASGARRNFIFGAIAGASILILAMDALPDWENFLRGSAGFFLGALIAHMHQAQQIRVSRAVGVAAALSFFCFLCVNSDKSLGFLIYPLAALLIASLVSSTDWWLKRALRQRPLLYLGRISYSIYMCHAFVLWTVSVVLKYALARPEYQGADGVWILQLSGLEMLLATLAVVALTLVFATLLHKHVEQPLREKSREFSFRSRVFRRVAEI